ncbi:MAG: hypothetical protein H6882_03440 [Rhodobiaceae bacterium]|nr:hypothetical protein [Rhodobiaceae bacterium]
MIQQWDAKAKKWSIITGLIERTAKWSIADHGRLGPPPRSLYRNALRLLSRTDTHASERPPDAKSQSLITGGPNRCLIPRCRAEHSESTISKGTITIMILMLKGACR